jgi:hypothetical protein
MIGCICTVGHCDVWKLLLQEYQEKKARSINFVLVPSFLKCDMPRRSYSSIDTATLAMGLADMK